jgi:signal transduction histidine kinase
MVPLCKHRPFIAEVSHRINNPLAAIRNALYLAACRTQDVEVLRYLALANEEVTAIASEIKEMRAEIEQEATPKNEFASPEVQIMKQVA